MSAAGQQPHHLPFRHRIQADCTVGRGASVFAIDMVSEGRQRVDGQLAETGIVRLVACRSSAAGHGRSSLRRPIDAVSAVTASAAYEAVEDADDHADAEDDAAAVVSQKHPGVGHAELSTMEMVEIHGNTIHSWPNKSGEFMPS
ncbi:hypothetical protein OPV22_013392 [Ensete ventricosum]|uniref:Uncharacterized protein n=1 Tax=Ensete ventricosum TaxID=4639 RepID=A0AAV8R9K4_ENSVE|nr:hypothetical protein OPV22_013392 [Ensete ventricosum]